MSKTVTTAQKLFDLLDGIGEGLYGALHIVDMSDAMNNDGAFRVYHSSGYCFNVSKKDVSEDDAKPQQWSYEFSAEWPEFTVLDVHCATNLMLDWQIGNQGSKK